MPRDDLIQWRRGSAASWTSVNPILASGEPGVELDTGKFKVGDGSTAWNSLDYVMDEPGAGDGDMVAATYDPGNIAANVYARANHTGTQSADTITDGTTNHTFTAADDTKLTGIATGATANDTNVNLRNRSTHTGTQTASTISDFAEVARDTLGAALVEGAGIDINVDDAANTITITSTGGGGGGGGVDSETIRDTINATLVEGTNVKIVIDDGDDTITISSPTRVIPFGYCQSELAHGSYGGFNTEELIREVLQGIEDSGATYVRVAAWWFVIEPVKDAGYVWTGMDQFLNLVSEYNLTPLVCITAPAPTGVTPTDYTQLCSAIAARYGAEGTGQLSYYEIWNEQNNTGPAAPFNTGGTPFGPATYTSLLINAATAIRTADSESTIVFGGLMSTVDFSTTDIAPSTYLQGVIDNGGSDYFDIFNVHWYSGAVDFSDQVQEPSREHLIYLDMIECRQILVDEGLSDKPFWLTEMGFPIVDETADPVLRADWMVEQIELLRDLQFIDVFFLYNYKDQPGLADAAKYGAVDEDAVPYQPLWDTVANINAITPRIPTGSITSDKLADALPGGGGISDVVEDTTPQLGGNLDLNSHTVGTATAADLTKLHALTADSTELNYVDGVTSAIQTQLNTKYAPSGTDVALADGGTGASLTDPNADRILFWDDSAGAVTWLTPGTNLTVTGTTIAASGSGGGGGSWGVFQDTIGDGVDTSIPVVHNLSGPVLVGVRDASTDEVVYCQVTITDDDTVTLDFEDAPAADSLVVTVVGGTASGDTASLVPQLPNAVDVETLTSTGTVSAVSNNFTTTIAGGVLAVDIPTQMNLVGLVGTDTTNMATVASVFKGPGWKPDFTTGNIGTVITAPWAVDIWVSGTRYVEFVVGRSDYSVVAGYAYRVWVDGRKKTNLPVVTGLGTLGQAATIKVDLGSGVTNAHRVRLEMSAMAMSAIWVEATGTVWAAKNSGPRLFIMGPSTAQSSIVGTNTGYELGTYVSRFANLIGIQDVWNDGEGGTGPHTSSSGYANYKTRATTTLIPAAPDIVLLDTWVNDQGAGRTAAQIAADYGTTIDTIKASLPNVKILVIGGIDSTGGTYTSTMTTIDNAVEATVTAKGAAFFSGITGRVVGFDGTLLATTGQWITTANASLYISAVDNFHPTDAGHEYFAYMMREMWRLIFDADEETGGTAPASGGYAPGGTDVALADGGTGASLVDPNADRIMFWDDSAGSVAFLAPGTNLSITGTTLDASAGGGGGDVTGQASSVDSEVALFSGTTGKIIKRATGSGIPKLTSGVLSIGTAGTDYVAPGGALGTPSSGTATNLTGLPVSGITASTSTALGVGSVELGHATDTTLSRSAAGVLAVEGVDVLTTSNTKTVTQKWIQPRVVSPSVAGTYTIDWTNCDQYVIGTQNAAITNLTATGTAVDGQKLLLRIKGDATPRTIAWDSAKYVSSGVATLLATTAASKTHFVGLIYDGVLGKMVCVAVDATGY